MLYSFSNDSTIKITNFHVGKLNIEAKGSKLFLKLSEIG